MYHEMNDNDCIKKLIINDNDIEQKQFYSLGTKPSYLENDCANKIVPNQTAP